MAEFAEELLKGHVARLFQGVTMCLLISQRGQCQTKLAGLLLLFSQNLVYLILLYACKMASARVHCCHLV